MSQPEGQRLDSWKEIAAYLGRDRTTVQRWEREKRLPVHRVPGGERRAVFAYRAQIDAWLEGLGDEESATTYPETGPMVPDPYLPHASGDSGTSTTLGPATRAEARMAALRAWQWSRWAWLVAVVCGLTFVLIGFGRGWYDGPIARLGFNGSALVARNAGGAILWSYDFGLPLNPNEDDYAQRVAIVDLGPRRRGDALVTAPLWVPGQSNSSSDALYLLSARGKLRWRHAFDDRPRFGGHDSGPPWFSSALMVTSNGATPSIWSAAAQAFGAASTLTEIDPDGRTLAQFVNWGHIAVLSHVHTASGSYILVGGISNQCDCAMLAVLREDHPSGSSPPLPGSAANCENCAEGRPYRYILFPRSELTMLSGAAYSNLRVIHVDGSHVWVGVAETASEKYPGSDWEKYELSEDFVPLSFGISDHYWVLHRQMEAEGKIHHKTEQCPERTHSQTVRMWSPEHGWQEIAVPVAAEP